MVQISTAICLYLLCICRHGALFSVKYKSKCQMIITDVEVFDDCLNFAHIVNEWDALTGTET